MGLRQGTNIHYYWGTGVSSNNRHQRVLPKSTQLTCVTQNHKYCLPQRAFWSCTVMTSSVVRPSNRVRGKLKTLLETKEKPEGETEPGHPFLLDRQTCSRCHMYITSSLTALYKAHCCLNRMLKGLMENEEQLHRQWWWAQRSACVLIKSSNLMIASIHSLLPRSKGHWFLLVCCFKLCKNYTDANSMQTDAEHVSSGTRIVDVFHIKVKIHIILL